MIKTKDIEMSAGKYFQLLAIVRFQKTWHTYLLPFVVAIAIYFIFPDYTMLYKFLAVYGLVNPLWILIYLYIHATGNKAQHIRIKRYFEIDEENITAVHQDNTTSKIEMEDVVGVKELKNEMLIYFSKSAFLYIPYDSFEGDDLNTFKNWLSKEVKNA